MLLKHLYSRVLIQGAMYKQMEAGLRHAQIQQLARQLDILEQTIEGPFALGQSISHSDASIFPTLDFMVCWDPLLGGCLLMLTPDRCMAFAGVHASINFWLEGRLPQPSQVEGVP